MNSIQRDNERPKQANHRRHASFAAALAGLLLLACPALAADDAHAESAPAEAVGTGEILVAESVCQAHEYRLRAEEDPTLVVEIPPEFAGQWPSRSASVSYTDQPLPPLWSV